MLQTNIYVFMMDYMMIFATNYYKLQILGVLGVVNRILYIFLVKAIVFF